MSENPKKLGAPTKPPEERHTSRVYVYCRPRDLGPALRQALRKARDQFEARSPS